MFTFSPSRSPPDSHRSPAIFSRIVSAAAGFRLMRRVGLEAIYKLLFYHYDYVGLVLSG
jgi:hypothetical protein